MSAVTLNDLASSVVLHDHGAVDGPDLGEGVVRSVVALRATEEIDDLTAGTLVVLEPAFNVTARSYRFDLALRKLPSGIPAVIVPADRWETPSLTAERIAADRSIALGYLKPGEDAVSLAVLVQHLVDAEAQPGIDIVERVASEVDRCLDIESIPALLDSCSAHIGARLHLVDRTDSPEALALRCAGLIKSYLVVDEGNGDGAPSPVVLKSVSAQVARHIEMLFEADYEARALPALTRSELFNEILLSDAATGADAVNRLRRSDFPIDGSHFAVRVDCHDPLPGDPSLQAVARCQARISEIFLDSLRRCAGQWTQAGTANSILLISTTERAHSDLAASAIMRTLVESIDEVAAQYPGLRLHVGMGTPHLGAVGFRSSVSEAATALRASRTRGNINHVEQFDRLGLGRALVRWAEIDGVRPVINQIMAPILQQPIRQRKETIQTLRAYLDAGRNVAKTAEALHLHRNTVRYRLDRIASMLAVDLDDPDDRLLLELSCRVVDAELL